MLDGVIKNATNGYMCSIGDMFLNLVTFAPMLLLYPLSCFQAVPQGTKKQFSCTMTLSIQCFRRGFISGTNGTIGPTPMCFPVNISGKYFSRRTHSWSSSSAATVETLSDRPTAIKQIAKL